MDEDTRRAGSHADDPPHLVKWGVLKKADVDGFLLAPAQGSDGISQQRICLAALRHVHRVGGCCPAETETRPPALTALMIAGEVDDRPIEPRAEATHFARCSRGEPYAHKSLLNDVLSHAVITDEQGCETDRGAVQREHQRLDAQRPRRL